MNQTVTVGMILYPLLVIGGLVAFIALAFFLLDLFNPFRSGH